jgi:hypothetical protein
MPSPHFGKVQSNLQALGLIELFFPSSHSSLLSFISLSVTAPLDEKISVK